MRISCNGCRVLRKGCSENCTIRPCLQWIPDPQSQANATIFLAKFYGRAGLINLINAGQDDLRPAIFKSLLYEACGRIVDPINGSVGLVSTGNWQLCQAAVEAVLNGQSIPRVSSEMASSPPLKTCDIRHVSKTNPSSSSSDQLHKVKSKNQFKRLASKPKPKMDSELRGRRKDDEVHELAISESASLLLSLGGDGGEGDSESVETVEASLVKAEEAADESNLELELTLGIKPITRKVGPGMNRSNGCRVQVGRRR